VAHETHQEIRDFLIHTLSSPEVLEVFFVEASPGGAPHHDHHGEKVLAKGIQITVAIAVGLPIK
jgi:hypothetical protein